MSALPYHRAVNNQDEMTNDKDGGTPRQAGSEQAATGAAAASVRDVRTTCGAGNDVAGGQTESQLTVSEHQSQFVDEQDADEIPGDLKGTFAQMLELRSKDPALFDRLMRAVQGHSSPLPSVSPAPSANRAPKAASSVASAQEALPAHRTFSYVGIKPGSVADKGYDNGRGDAASTIVKNGNGDEEAQLIRNLTAQDQKLPMPSMNQSLTAQLQTQPQSQQAKERADGVPLAQSATTSASKKPTRRPFFSEARRLVLSRVTSHYLSTKAANAGRNFSPEFCYNILAPDSEGFTKICEMFEEAGLYLDRMEYAKVLMTTLRTPLQQTGMGSTPSKPQNLQTRLQPQMHQRRQDPFNRLSTFIEMPHGHPAVTADAIQHQHQHQPSGPSNDFIPGVQTSWPGAPPASIAYSPLGTMIPTPQSQSGTHAFFPFAPQPIPNTSTPSYQQASRKYAMNSHYRRPAFAQVPHGAPPTQAHLQHHISRFSPLPQQVQPPSGIINVSTPQTEISVAARGDFSESMPPGLMPNQRNPSHQRRVPQTELQHVQQKQGPQGQFLVQSWTGPETAPHGRGKEHQEKDRYALPPQEQQVAIPYYPLPPQLAGKLGSAMPPTVPAGVKRGHTAPRQINGTHEFIQHRTKKPRLSDGTGSLRDDQATQPQIPGVPTNEPKPFGESVSPYAVKSRPGLVKKLDREKALKIMMYDPATIARDILIAAGRHPTMRPLNEHLKVLHEFSSVDNESDLATFRWDIVDPVDSIPSDLETTRDDNRTTKEGDKQKEPATSKQDEVGQKERATSEQHQDRQMDEDATKHHDCLEKGERSQTPAPAAQLLADFLGVAEKADTVTKERLDSETAT
ncbi:hypothetical protein KEM54_002495 [Ascosphaera aggregata]|nr:hypothetical protein KEM54_002495 [Ascosphaera aggregata]